MAPYLPILRRDGRARIIYDAHNAEHQIQRRAFVTDAGQPARWPAALYSWLQIPRLERLEAEVCRSVSTVTCVSHEDAAALKHLAPALQPIVVPNGIDLDAYSSYASHAPPYPARLAFTGKMDYRPNVDAALWFIHDILPRVRARRPEAEFVVVGQRPLPQLLNHNGRHGVIVTGAVEDARPFIAEAGVYVAPLRMGGGTRFKLLEAMALARPIVSTTLGAEGFGVQAGRELLIADAPGGFAQAVLALLDDPARAEALGRAGRAFVRAGYDWSAIIPRMEAAYS
jgi:glycosyltransferase involved in cell wall biosynthesis